MLTAVIGVNPSKIHVGPRIIEGLVMPNPTPHVDARDAAGNLDSPAARAGGRER